MGEGRAAAAAAEAMARQPRAAGEILRTMLVGQAVAESASIFALVVALLLLFRPAAGAGLLEATALFAAGLTMGLGAFGPGLGAGLPAARACLALGRNPRAAQPVTTAMLVGQAVAQTPAVFALLVALLLLHREPGAAPTLAGAAALLGAGISTGAAAVGPGLGAGTAAAAAVDATGRFPQAAPSLLRVMLVGQAVSQSTSVYALLVSLILLYLA